MLNEDAILDINTGQPAKLDVLFQDEVQLDINVPLFYIKSGEEEIKQYVDEVAKPEIDVYVENKKDVITEAAANGVDTINKATENAEQILNNYIEEVSKPELQSFADGLEEAFDNNAVEKTAAVNALAEQAAASAEAAALSSSAAQTAASAASDSASEALKSAGNAEQAAGNAADYASQAEASAGAAKTSETNAKSSETAASGSAASAESFKTAAEKSAELSAASADASEASAQTATHQAGQAGEHQISAKASAGAAEAWAIGSIEEQPAGSAKYWAEKINPDNLADVDLSNLSSAGNAKLPLPWSYFLARNMLADGSIAKDQVRTFTLDYLTNDRLYEVIGSIFFTSNGIVTIRCGSNPTILNAMASNPVAGTFVVTDSSRGAGTFTALVKNKRIGFSNTGSVTATGVYINVAAFREVGD
jgi:chemotaxis protein histidine kinase CheA